ncbi:hypothetical protein SDC9_204547 [bioreactor metagenome]|uniref:Uncharacterized protein n=1 Tax=bioreactor metagenome TaxID=1076179 RepID=A0A645J8Q5_9ZZZZ
MVIILESLLGSMFEALLDYSEGFILRQEVGGVG